MLIWLWKRLSNGGAEASVSGRALRRFPEREVEGLLRARVLIETRKTDSWSVCPQCDCGLDVRPIRRVGDEIRACCPHDAAEDIVLTEDDLKRFSIDGERLAGEIAASGGLVGNVARIDDGLWLIGKAPSAHSVVLCRNPERLEAPGMILAVKAAAGGTRVALIVPAIDPTHAIRCREAGITVLDLGEVMIRDQSGTDRLVVERIRENPQVEGVFSDGVTSKAARLLISRSRRSVQLDGRDFVLSLTEFDCFLGAAEKVAAGLVMLTYQELYALTNRATHRDVINELRDKLQKQGLTRDQAFDLVQTVHGRGLTINLPRQDIDIRD
jgi:hypothetical protein